MPSYKVADGHDVAEVDLVTLSPQPRTTGIQPVRREYALTGKPAEQGRYVILVYDVLENEAMYLDVLEAFGLDDALENEVTIYCRDERWQWVRVNGKAILPEMGRDARWNNLFPRNIEILVRDITDVS